MKKGIILITSIGVLVFAGLTYANATKNQLILGNSNNNLLLVSETKSSLNKVQRKIAEDEAEIISDKKKLEAEIEKNRVKYRDRPLKLAEKEREYKLDLEELNFDKKKLQFKKDHINLLTKIEEKRYQIHIERRNGNSDWAKIEKLTKERDTLEAEYEKKKLDYLYK